MRAVDRLRPGMWVAVLLIAASQFYLFWALLAALLLFAVLAVPGSLLAAAWFLAWRSAGKNERDKGKTPAEPGA